MREIKFRAWTGEEMTEPCNLWDRNDSPIEWLNNLPYPDSVLMQYTGLKDKNGKEIYEGDIVTSHAGYNLVVEWNDFYCGFYMKYLVKDGMTFGFASLEPQWLEVIGNIYSNPELLGVK